MGCTATVSPWQEVLCLSRPQNKPWAGTHGGETATGQVYPEREQPHPPGMGLSLQPRGVRSAFVGWDLGRNDHTDEVGRGRPAELAGRSLRDRCPICTLCRE